MLVTEQPIDGAAERQTIGRDTAQLQALVSAMQAETLVDFQAIHTVASRITQAAYEEWKKAALAQTTSTDDAGRATRAHPTRRHTHAISVLIDEGLSGTTMDRPGLRRLRELVQTKAIAAAIVYDPDRLSRNLGHQLLLAEEFECTGVKLVIVSHPLEQEPKGWLFFQMRGALAEYERAKILERTHRGIIGRAKAGNPWGGQAPLGYRAIREPHRARWEIDDEGAALVRRILAMCLSGMSTYAITEQLSLERMPTGRERGAPGGRSRRRTPGIWNEASVHKILTNEAYTGRAYFGKYRRLSKTTGVRRPPAEWNEIPVSAIVDGETLRRWISASPRPRGSP